MATLESRIFLFFAVLAALKITQICRLCINMYCGQIRLSKPRLSRASNRCACGSPCCASQQRRTHRQAADKQKSFYLGQLHLTVSECFDFLGPLVQPENINHVNFKVLIRLTASAACPGCFKYYLVWGGCASSSEASDSV